MTPIGHVSLNSVQYRLRRPPVQILANQMAPKVSSGESEYASLDTWSAWIQESWQDGVGQTRPHRDSSGFLYGEVETRVPNQIILSPAMYITPQVGSTSAYELPVFAPAQATNYSSVTLGNTYLAVMMDVKAFGTKAVLGVWVLATATPGAVIEASWYTNVSAAPGTIAGSAASVTFTAASAAVGEGTISTPGPLWYHIPLSVNATNTGTGDKWLVLRVTTGSVVLHGSTDVPPLQLSKTSTNGTTWAATTFHPFFLVYFTMTTTEGSPNPNSTVAITWGNNPTYTWGAAAVVENATAAAGAVIMTAFPVLNGSSGGIGGGLTTDQISYDQTGTAVSVATYANQIVVARGAASSILRYNIDGTAPAAPTGNPAADVVHAGGGYLWRAVGEDIYYTSNTDLAAANWAGPFQVTNTPFKVRSIAYMEGAAYMACDDGLYTLAPGDFVTGVTPWAIDAENGKSMVAFNGALYIVVNGRILRYSPDGSVQDVWITRDDDLPALRLGEVTSVAASDTSVLALVKESSAYGRSSLWAFQGEHWHHMATMPFRTSSCVYYDRDKGDIYVGNTTGNMVRIKVPDFALNPYNDPNTLYSPAGWIEWDWFRGNVREVDKDWESITLLGDFSATAPAKVYWKDTDSTDWELLGTVTADGQELRWPVSTRPNSTKIKVGILLTTTTPYESAKIEAVRVKYHPMVKDWYRWSLVVDVSGGMSGGVYQEMINGEPNTLNATQIKANLDTLATRIPPFIYVDVDGSQYQVKVTEGTFNYDTVTYNEQSSAKEWEGTYSLTLEQVTQGTYSA